MLAEQNENAFRQEAVIHQKARLKWLKNGDLNSKKFHSLIKWRRVRNEINGLFVDGHWCEDKEVVKDKVKDFLRLGLKVQLGLKSGWIMCPLTLDQMVLTLGSLSSVESFLGMIFFWP